ncbi:hypothetical protein D9M69_565920 [compost metagenome]
MPATGSSSSSSFGSCMSSMPISSHCFWPWLRLPARRDTLSARWMVSSTSARRSLCAESSLNSIEARTPLSVFSASSRFSNTVRCSNTVGFWNLRPMPSWAMSASRWRSRSMVLPKNTWPLSGRVLPVMMSIIVVLPAPLGPMMQRSSPGAMSRLRPLMALKPSKLTCTSSRYRMRPCVVSTSPGV